MEPQKRAPSGASPYPALTEALTVYAPAAAVFRTPRGNPATMHYRTDSSDWNTLYSALNEGE